MGPQSTLLACVEQLENNIRDVVTAERPFLGTIYLLFEVETVNEIFNEKGWNYLSQLRIAFSNITVLIIALLFLSFP